MVASAEAENEQRAPNTQNGYGLGKGLKFKKNLVNTCIN